MTQLITVNEVKAACRKAYVEKRLLAQDPDPSAYGYRILGDDGVVRVCAIGAVLNDGTLNAIDARGQHSRTISNSYSYAGYAFSWDEAEALDLIVIQQAHDHWLRDVMGGEGSIIAERNFMIMIGL